jgi:hypothetical protein
LVHGELIKAGRVEPLTYKQVRRLENIDRRKAREQKELELLNTSIEAAGRTAQGIFQGTITGPIALVLLLTATYPAWLPPVEAAAGALATAIGQGIKGAATGPSAPPINLSGGSGNYGVRAAPQQWVAIIGSVIAPATGLIPGETYWFETAAQRDSFYSNLANNASLNWYWSFTKVQR